MIPRWLRMVVAVAVTALSSGIFQVVIAALDEDRCSEPCDGADAERCPPNCQSEVCAKVHASLAVVMPPSVRPQPLWPRTVEVAEASSELPLVVTAQFHPPKA